ncbi:hypothetical protein BaRGS_00009718 [Batillaria attramentaria]|uniref:Uncharacterized protein n=1 Tax=Batillaria attramentaria TaxID=370345 RepID=A0ABD0LJ02_9CAEN
MFPLFQNLKPPVDAVTSRRPVMPQRREAFHTATVYDPELPTGDQIHPEQLAAGYCQTAPALSPDARRVVVH